MSERMTKQEACGQAILDRETGQTHTFVEFSNGASSYLEMTCFHCGSIEDLVDFQRIDWLDAAENNFDMACPRCEHVGSVRNETN